MRMSLYVVGFRTSTEHTNTKKKNAASHKNQNDPSDDSEPTA